MPIIILRRMILGLAVLCSHLLGRTGGRGCSRCFMAPAVAVSRGSGLTLHDMLDRAGEVTIVTSARTDV